MTMNFWEAQRRARRETLIYLILFVLLTISAAVLLELDPRYFAQEQYSPHWPIFGVIFLTLTFIAAFFQYCLLWSSGGKHVVETLGAMLMGFYFVLYFAFRLLQISGNSRRSKGGNPALLVALFLLVAGALT